jgi:GDPmannose 4,6-dehydratase
VTNAAARIKLGIQKSLNMGNLDARRDWGFAGDYVKAMWMMLQQTTPKDYVVATGKSHTVEQLLDLAFQHVKLNFRDYVTIDPTLIRPAEVTSLCGDPGLVKKELGWEPETTFEQMIAMMVEEDLKRNRENPRAFVAAGHF